MRSVNVGIPARRQPEENPRSPEGTWERSPFAAPWLRGSVASSWLRGSVASWLGGYSPGFSLAEMMIALAILAMGLLVIGAALPVGFRYTRESVNLATGQAAAEHALDLIEQYINIPAQVLDASDVLIRAPVLFVPRNPNSGGRGAFLRDYEPRIKVRPLCPANIVATPGHPCYGAEFGTGPGCPWLVASAVEWVIGEWLPAGCHDAREWDEFNWLRPALPSICTVYPPVTPDDASEWDPSRFFGAPYELRPINQGSETLRALGRGIVWTACYRRVAYDDKSTAGYEGDPTLYEFVAVAVRKPSVRHRFPVQPGYAAALSASSVDSGAPVPWLVEFDQLPSPPRGFDYNTGFPLDADGNPLIEGHAPATLTFRCPQDQAGLFPVGAIFIPARNDVTPDCSLVTFTDRVGLGPPAPTTLPIYEVVERPDANTVIVKYNGYYPMKGTPGVSALATPDPSEWPVWVVPPCYEERDSAGNPVMSDRSPIVAIARRYVRLREIP